MMLRPNIIQVFRLVTLLFLATIPAIERISAQSYASARISFGRVSLEEPVEQVVVFRNSGQSILEIEKVETSPPLFADEVSPIVLPGMEGSFKIVMGNDRRPGDYEGTVVVHFKNFAREPIVIEVEGFIIPPIEFQPYPAFFLRAHRGKESSQSIEIVNHRGQPLYLRPVNSKSDRYSLRLETLEDGQRYRLTLTLDGNAEPGVQREEIALQADPPLTEPLIVQINTKIRERVYHFPDSIDMGALPSKVAKDENMVKTLSQILMVYRPYTDDFEVEASLDLDYIDMTVERGPNGDRYQMNLTLIPEKVKPGKIEGTVTIKTNDEEFPILEVPVTGYILE